MSRSGEGFSQAVIWRGRRWSVARYERCLERRAASWFGVGPAREDDPARPRVRAHIPSGSWSSVAGDELVLLDVPPGQPDPGGPVIGVAVHAGRWLWLVLWQPVGIRGSVRRTA